jgi:hypothetical protein
MTLMKLLLFSFSLFSFFKHDVLTLFIFFNLHARAPMERYSKKAPNAMLPSLKKRVTEGERKRMRGLIGFNFVPELISEKVKAVADVP